jgi:hypothetical protein
MGQMNVIHPSDLTSAEKERDIVKWDAEFQEHLKTQQQPLLEEISKGVMTKDLEAKIKAVIVSHVKVREQCLIS